MINVSSNAKSISSTLKGIQKQINYGISVGLNNVAEQIRNSELKSAQNTFTLRGTWWKPRNRFGFNVLPAKKTNLKAEVYTRADWLVMHAFGGIKIPKGSNIALPTEDVKRSKRDIITKANRPKNVKGAFKVTFKSGEAKGKSAIAKMSGRGKNRRLVILYWLEKRTKIKKEFDFYEIGKKVFDRNAHSFIRDGIELAFRTAK